MIHQREAVEADLISCQCEVSQPAGRILFWPRKPRYLEYYSRSCAWTMIMIGSRLHVDWCVGRTVLLGDQYLVPALVMSSVEQSFDLAELIGEDWRRNRSVALSVPLPAHCGRCVHDHEHCRKPGLAGETPVGCPPLLIQPESVDHRGQ